ncbi:hypothetical protein [Nocardioides sp.]|uniref:hypothetical protein n=1 Tax=Nocardioides sp. TaxID=35761 RepID=UPI0026389550|nr:hypothetical protein [Nocardioides sp.]
MKSKFLITGVAAAAVASTIAMTAPSALADPPSGTYRTYAAVGSDTIQDVWNALANTGGALAGDDIASYDAFTTPATTTIKTKAAGATFTRPTGSGEGVKALSAVWDSSYAGHAYKGTALVNGEVDFARSSSRPSGTGTALTYVAFARDAVSVAYRPTTGLSAGLDLTTSQLTELYSGVNDSTNDSGTAATVAIVSGVPKINGVTVAPKIPQSGSGTRSFFLGAIGVTTPASYVETSTAPSTLAENNGASIPNGGDLIPFSAAQWIAQTKGTTTSTISGLEIAKVNGSAPTNGLTGASAAPGPLFGHTDANGRYDTTPATGVGTFNRDTYNVADTANLGNDPVLANALTTDVKSAAARTTITNYGFGNLSYAGSTALTGPYVH